MEDALLAPRFSLRTMSPSLSSINSDVLTALANTNKPNNNNNKNDSVDSASIITSVLNIEDCASIEDRVELNKHNREGVLEVFRESLLKTHWKQEHFQIVNGLLYHLPHDSHTWECFDLITATAKQNTSHARAFDIITPSCTLLVRGADLDDMRLWMDSIQRGSQVKLQMLRTKEEVHVSRQKSARILSDLWTLVPGNRYCADCTTRDPMWLALDKGLCLCRVCASLHRSLDCSRIRCVVTDSIHPHFIQLFLELGNQFGNSVFACEVVSTASIPTKDTPEAIRLRWIEDKYKRKLFVASDETPKEILLENLRTASSTNDVRSLLFTLAKGVSPNAICDPSTGRTSLHIACQSGAVLACVFLVLNGAALDSMDSQGWTPLCHAVMHNHSEVAHALVCFGARLFRDELALDDMTSRVNILRRKQKTLEGFFGTGEGFVSVLKGQILQATPIRFCDFPIVTQRYLSNRHDMLDLTRMRAEVVAHFGNVVDEISIVDDEDDVALSTTNPQIVVHTHHVETKPRAHTVTSRLNNETSKDQFAVVGREHAWGISVDDFTVKYTYFFQPNDLDSLTNEADFKHWDTILRKKSDAALSDGFDQQVPDDIESSASTNNPPDQSQLSHPPITTTTSALPTTPHDTNPCSSAYNKKRSLTGEVAFLTLADLERGAIPPPPPTPPPDILLKQQQQKQHQSTSSIDSKPQNQHVSKGVTKEGILLAWSKSKVAGGFKEAHFYLSDGILQYSRNRKLKHTFDLLITTVRPVAHLPSGARNSVECCFEIISPYKKVLVRGHSIVVTNQWMAALQEATRIKLNELKHETTARRRASQTRASVPSNFSESLRKLREHDPSNQRCADCGCPNPDWCSINIGAVICIMCAGAHRSLGVHISKVRSLTIDKLEPNTEAMMMRLGNANVNTVMEAHFPQGHRKAIPGDLENRLRAYVINKYEKRLYMNPLPATEDDTVAAATTMLFDALGADDLVAALNAVFSGATVNTRDEHGLTPLIHAAKRGNTDMLIFLLNNGAQINMLDSNGWSALYHAVANKVGEKCIKFLVQAGGHTERGTSVLAQNSMETNTQSSKLNKVFGGTVDAQVVEKEASHLQALAQDVQLPNHVLEKHIQKRMTESGSEFAP